MDGRVHDPIKAGKRHRFSVQRERWHLLDTLTSTAIFVRAPCGSRLTLSAIHNRTYSEHSQGQRAKNDAVMVCAEPGAIQRETPRGLA